jgi:hypothetical protein
MGPLVQRSHERLISVHQWLDEMINAAAKYDGPPHEISKNAKLEMIWLDASGKPTGPEQGNLNPAEQAFFRRNNRMIAQWRKTGETGAYWVCVVCAGAARISINIIWDNCYFLIDTEPLMRADIIEYSKACKSLLTIPDLSVVK